MGNLRRRPNYMLLNSADGNTVTVLSGNTGVLIKNYGVIRADMVKSGFKCCYCEGIPKEILLNVRPNYPCDDCVDWSGGFDLMRDFHLTGRPEDFYGLKKPFMHGIDKNKLIVSTNGYLDPEDTEEACGNIVNNIGINNMENLNVVHAYQRQRYEAIAGAKSLTINDVGSNYTHTYTGATMAALTAAINADADKRVRVVTANANFITLESHDPGFGWTSVLNSGLEFDNTQVVSWIRLKAVSSLFTFDVSNYDGFCTVTVIEEGTKPKVHPDDVARLFPILPISFVGTQRDLPIKNAEYCVYNFKIIHDYAYDHSFANHLNQYYEEAYFYVLKSVAEGAHWETKLDAAGMMDGSLFLDSCSCPSESDGNYSQYDSQFDSDSR